MGHITRHYEWQGRRNARPAGVGYPRRGRADVYELYGQNRRINLLFSFLSQGEKVCNGPSPLNFRMKNQDGVTPSLPILNRFDYRACRKSFS